MDQKIKYYTCKRISKRWPFVLWTNTMDVAANNSFILFDGQHPDYFSSSHKRRLFIMELAEELMKPFIVHRSSNPKLKISTKEAIRRCGIQVSNIENMDDIQSKKRRCFICPHDRDRKISTCCVKCKNNVCGEHSNVFCKKCIDN